VRQLKLSTQLNKPIFLKKHEGKIMAKIPEPTITIQKLIDEWHESRKETERYHLGCSEIGEECERKIWLNFRKAFNSKFKGRILRVFRRGQNEEDIVISDLRAIGVDVQNTGRNQKRVHLDCHLSGSIDGIIMEGLPHAPKSKAILEIKTHSIKSFNEVKEKGVKESKFQHYVQMQLYMSAEKLDRALYFAVCKDNDEIYDEWVHFDKEVANTYIERGHRIALSEHLPQGISTSPTWYQCKMCDFHGFCHEKQPIERAHCRTCAHVTPKNDSNWHCAKWDATIPKEAQLEGCNYHVLHPELVPYELQAAEQEWHAIYIINGKAVLNGNDGFSSKEILANPAHCAEPDDFIKTLREEMGAKVIG
jgi:hypothetical protein